MCSSCWEMMGLWQSTGQMCLLPSQSVFMGDHASHTLRVLFVPLVVCIFTPLPQSPWPVKTFSHPFTHSCIKHADLCAGHVPGPGNKVVVILRWREVQEGWSRVSDGECGVWWVRSVKEAETRFLLGLWAILRILDFVLEVGSY